MAAILMVFLVFCLCAFAEGALAEGTAAPVAPIVDLTGIVTALLGLLATVITAYVVPWVKVKIGEERYRMAVTITQTLVSAAEQLYGAGRGPEKLQYVKAELAKRGFNIDTAAIEAAVRELTGNV